MHQSCSPADLSFKPGHVPINQTHARAHDIGDFGGMARRTRPAIMDDPCVRRHQGPRAQGAGTRA